MPGPRCESLVFRPGGWPPTWVGGRGRAAHGTLPGRRPDRGTGVLSCGWSLPGAMRRKTPWLILLALTAVAFFLVDLARG
ncbi:MAG: hypothetical protein ACC662_00455, partial [Planctomycetota bacterium]